MKNLSEIRGPFAATWGNKRLKYVASCNDEVLQDSTDPAFEFPYVDIGNVSSTGEITGTEPCIFKNAPSRARRVVRDGDVIVSTVRTYLKAIAMVEEPPENLVVSTGFAVVRPRAGVCARFLGYFLRSEWFVNEVVARSTGVSYPAINASGIMGLPVLLPGEKQQKNIADYLDRETAKIDALIEEKRKLLGLLEDKRRAVINRAVTQGLDPNVRMKESGVPWLGEIPEHWGVSRLKFICGLITQKASHESKLPYIGMECVESWTGKAFESDGYKPTGETLMFDSRHVLFGKLRPYLAKAFCPQYSGRCSGEFLVLEPHTLNKEYLLFNLLNPAFIVTVNNSTFGSKMPRADWRFIGNLQIPLPPLEEQIAVAKYVVTKSSSINHLKQDLQSLILRIQTRRTALITAAVTGQMDVRGEADRETTQNGNFTFDSEVLRGKECT